jgi:hypothetical protein
VPTIIRPRISRICTDKVRGENPVRTGYRVKMEILDWVGVRSTRSAEMFVRLINFRDSEMWQLAVLALAVCFSFVNLRVLGVKGPETPTTKDTKVHEGKPPRRKTTPRENQHRGKLKKLPPISMARCPRCPAAQRKKNVVNRDPVQKTRLHFAHSALSV